MSDVRVGDWVRITHEGEVTRNDLLGFKIGGVFFDKALYDVEVLERRKPRVGDVIEKRSGLVNLPNHAVVTDGSGFPLIINAFSGRAIGYNGVYLPLAEDRSLDHGPFTVVYIPGE